MTSVLTKIDCTLCENAFGRYCVPKSSQHRPAPQEVLRGGVWERETIEFMRNHVGSRDIGMRRAGSLGGGSHIRRCGIFDRFPDDAAGGGAEQAADGAEEGGFAGAVGTDEGDDFTGLDLHGDFVQGFDRTVGDIDFFDVEEHGDPDDISRASRLRRASLFM